MKPWTIYHNPSCSNARGALALLREHGIEPRIVEYKKTPLSAPELRALLAQLKVPVRELLRSKEAAYAELNLADAGKSDDELIAALAAHPELMQRPVVVAPSGRAAICRPPEVVLTLIAAA